MANIKRYAVILLLGVALCGCSAENTAETDPDGAATEEAVKELSPLEKNTIGAAGTEELSAVYGTGILPQIVL